MFITKKTKKITLAGLHPSINKAQIYRKESVQILFSFFFLLLETRKQQKRRQLLGFIRRVLKKKNRARYVTAKKKKGPDGFY